MISCIEHVIRRCSITSLERICYIVVTIWPDDSFIANCVARIMHPGQGV